MRLPKCKKCGKIRKFDEICTGTTVVSTYTILDNMEEAELDSSENTDVEGEVNYCCSYCATILSRKDQDLVKKFLNLD